MVLVIPSGIGGSTAERVGKKFCWPRVTVQPLAAPSRTNAPITNANVRVAQRLIPADGYVTVVLSSCAERVLGLVWVIAKRVGNGPSRRSSWRRETRAVHAPACSEREVAHGVTANQEVVRGTLGLHAEVAEDHVATWGEVTVAR